MCKRYPIHHLNNCPHTAWGKSLQLSAVCSFCRRETCAHRIHSCVQSSDLAEACDCDRRKPGSTARVSQQGCWEVLSIEEQQNGPLHSHAHSAAANLFHRTDGSPPMLLDWWDAWMIRANV
eukprot:3121339-Amphidinium_carterae.1